MSKNKTKEEIIKEIENLKIEIFPDKNNGKWGDYENNLVWTDGHTIAQMEDHILSSLFWENDAGQHRDRLWVKLDKEIINQILSRQREEFKKIVEGMEVDKNFNPLWKNGYFKAQSDILEKIEKL